MMDRICREDLKEKTQRSRKRRELNFGERRGLNKRRNKFDRDAAYDEFTNEGYVKSD
jgi:hypothetical protein